MFRCGRLPTNDFTRHSEFCSLIVTSLSQSASLNSGCDSTVWFIRSPNICRKTLINVAELSYFFFFSFFFLFFFFSLLLFCFSFLYQYTTLSSRVEDSRQMYCGGSVIGKASLVDPEILPTSPVIFTGGGKSAQFGLIF